MLVGLAADQCAITEIDRRHPERIGVTGCAGHTCHG